MDGTMAAFPFPNLPIELACKIIKFATTTGTIVSEPNTKLLKEGYKAACALALVSTSMRTLTMPFLLHTVVLSSNNAVFLFLQAVHLQASYFSMSPRLRIDYTKHIRQFWSTTYNSPIQPEGTIDLRPLYNVLCNIEELGFHCESIKLFVEVLEYKRPWTCLKGPLPDWKTKRLTLTGLPRWDCVISSFAGLSFLRHLTHLTIWGPVTRAYRPMPLTIFRDSDPRYQIPDWVLCVPFGLMPELKHFEHTLIDPKNREIVPIVTFTRPKRRKPSQTSTAEPQETQRTVNDLGIFWKWLTSPKPLSHGVIRLVDNFSVSLREGAYISPGASEVEFYRQSWAGRSRG